MVKLLTLLLVIIPWLPLAAVKVSVDLESSTLLANHPISGTLSVVHETFEKIDPTTVLIGGLALPVEVHDGVPVGSEVKTLLTFSLQAQPTGLHLLPPISVMVNNQRYTTTPQAYSITTGANPTPVSSVGTYGSTPHDQVWIKFESIVEGKTTLFPGQITTVGYRYYFRGVITLDDEKVPLLLAEGFRKVGEPKTVQYQDKSYNMQLVTQQIQAIDPGEYVFPEGKISGQALVTVGSIAQPTPVQATAAAVTLTVKPFPATGKPASFNGAVGTDFQFGTRLLSLYEISVGDKFTLSLDITGLGDLSSVPMPEICCQPGFSGNFQQSDIPPIGVVKGQTKYFVVDIRPLTTVKEIPKVEFSYFNPESESYVTLHSQPIPVTVHPSNTPYNKALQQAEQPANGPAWPATSSASKPLDITSNVPVVSGDFRNRYFGNGWVLLLIPLALLFLWYQQRLKRAAVAAHPQLKAEAATKESSQWLNTALENKQDPSKLYHSLERAFVNLLHEKGEIPSRELTAHQLPETGESGKVRSFLLAIEERLYAGQGGLEIEKIKQQARTLFDEIANR